MGRRRRAFRARFIEQQQMQDPLADLILKGEVRDGSTIHVDEGDGALKLTPA